MFNISNKKLIFISGSVMLLICSFGIELTKYEYTTLQNLNNNYSKLIIKPETYKKMYHKPKANEWFMYFKENQMNMQKISQVDIKNNQYEIILSGNIFPEQFTLISYKTNKTPLIKSIFSI